VQRLKTWPQFQAALAGGTVARTAHFALHKLRLPCGSETLLQPFAPDSGSAPSLEQALFGLGQSWLGAMTPKRWARRAVTRNAIRRQVYAVGQGYGACLPCAAHVVRLRAGFDRQKFPSAASDALRAAARAELAQLLDRAMAPKAPA